MTPAQAIYQQILADRLAGLALIVEVRAPRWSVPTVPLEAQEYRIVLPAPIGTQLHLTGDLGDGGRPANATLFTHTWASSWYASPPIVEGDDLDYKRANDILLRFFEPDPDLEGDPHVAQN